ncbi:hypothetical protein ACJX0J_026034, partial [Zea mays]
AISGVYPIIVLPMTPFFGYCIFRSLLLFDLPNKVYIYMKPEDIFYVYLSIEELMMAFLLVLMKMKIYFSIDTPVAHCESVYHRGSRNCSNYSFSLLLFETKFTDANLVSTTVRLNVPSDLVGSWADFSMLYMKRDEKHNEHTPFIVNAHKCLLQSALQKMQENLKEAHAAILTTQNKELEKAEDLENKLIEFQKQSDELSQETQEQASKVIQLQELVERLESKIATLESEIELLHNNSALAIQAVVTPEMNQTTIIEEFDKGHQLEEVKTVNEARETGALKEAKDKLEKRVEELTWRLDVEKRLRADLEEAKSHEIEKLQSALQKMQENLKEAHAAIVNEKEAAKLAIEQAPPKIVEVPVIDNAKLEELTTQNKELEETQEQASKVIQLQELVERLESKIATLESEIELLHNNSALAIQAVVTPEMNQTTIIELEEVKTVNVCAINFTWQTFIQYHINVILVIGHVFGGDPVLNIVASYFLYLPQLACMFIWSLFLERFFFALGTNQIVQHYKKWFISFVQIFVIIYDIVTFINHTCIHLLALVSQVHDGSKRT